MNKRELIDAIAEANDNSKAKAKEVLDSILSSIIEAAKRGEEVTLAGFGRFSLKERNAHEGRNPATGVPLAIPASRSLGFKMSRRQKLQALSRAR